MCYKIGVEEAAAGQSRPEFLGETIEFAKVDVERNELCRQDGI